MCTGPLGSFHKLDNPGRVQVEHDDPGPSLRRHHVEHHIEVVVIGVVKAHGVGLFYTDPLLCGQFDHILVTVVAIVSLNEGHRDVGPVHGSHEVYHRLGLGKKRIALL